MKNKELIKSIIKSSMLEMMYEESVHNIEVIDYVIDNLVKNLSLLKSIKDSSNIASSNYISEIIKNVNEVVDLVRNVRNVDRKSKDLEKLYSKMWILEGIEKDLENLQYELYLTEENMKKIIDLKEIISEIEELIRNENINKILKENIDLDELEKRLALIKKNVESLEKRAENYNLYSIISKYNRICGEGL